MAEVAAHFFRYSIVCVASRVGPRERWGRRASQAFGDVSAVNSSIDVHCSLWRGWERIICCHQCGKVVDCPRQGKARCGLDAALCCHYAWECKSRFHLECEWNSGRQFGSRDDQRSRRRCYLHGTCSIARSECGFSHGYICYIACRFICRDCDDYGEARNRGRCVCRGDESGRSCNR